MILEPKKFKSATVSIVFPSIWHEVMGPDTMIFAFWMWSFKPTFSHLFHFHQETLSFFTFCHKGGFVCISEVILMFLPAILIPACASSSPALLMRYSAYKLNKQGDNIQPWHTPFPIWNQAAVSCPVLTVASWSAYEVGQVVWLFWQNVVHWWREWQTTSVFLPWKPHEQYEKEKNRTLKDELLRLEGA